MDYNIFYDIFRPRSRIGFASRFFVRVIDKKSILTTRDPTVATLGSPTGFDCVRKRTPLKMTRVVGLRYHKTTVERIIRPCHPERNEVKSNAERDT